MAKALFAALTGLVVVAVTVVLLASASAPASKCSLAHARRGARVNTLVPPGNSSVSEYVENVPTARGGCPSAALRAAASAGAIPRSTERALVARGVDGVATAALVRATSAVGAGFNVPGLPSAGGEQAARGAASGSGGGGRSPAGAVIDALGGSSGGGGLGTLLPIVLIVSLLATAAMVLLRRRRS